MGEAHKNGIDNAELLLAVGQKYFSMGNFRCSENIFRMTVQRGGGANVRSVPWFCPNVTCFCLNFPGVCLNVPGFCLSVPWLCLKVPWFCLNPWGEKKFLMGSLSVGRFSRGVCALLYGLLVYTGPTLHTHTYIYKTQTHTHDQTPCNQKMSVGYASLMTTVSHSFGHVQRIFAQAHASETVLAERNRQ
jgi:hypothetical protein